MRGIAVVIAAALVLAPAAGAHGDPGSEDLARGDVFLALQPPESSPTGRRLEALAAAARRRSFPLKIAVVARRRDLGLLPEYFARPDAYAAYLQRELRDERRWRGTIVVVMPGRVAVAGPARTPAVLTVVRTLAVPRTGDVGALGRAAEVASRRVAAAAGHRLPRVHAAAPENADADRRVILIGAAALLALVVLGSQLRNRRRRTAVSS